MLLAVVKHLLQRSIQFMLLCIITCQGRYVLLLSQARIMTCCMQYNAAAILGMSLWSSLDNKGFEICCIKKAVAGQCTG